MSDSLMFVFVVVLFFKNSFGADNPFAASGAAFGAAAFGDVGASADGAAFGTTDDPFGDFVDDGIQPFFCLFIWGEEEEEGYDVYKCIVSSHQIIFFQFL